MCYGELTNTQLAHRLVWVVCELRRAAGCRCGVSTYASQNVDDISLRMGTMCCVVLQVGKLDIALCGNLNEIFKGYHVLNFIETTMSDKSIIRYHQVDQWMSVAIADESEIGQFAANHLVDFFRPLLEAWPFTLDWLATASEADRYHFRKVRSPNHQLRPRLTAITSAR
jgi:hypothetical protein